MAITKNALVRYKVLDRCFRNPGRQYTLDDLLEACNEALFELEGNDKGIQRRQLQKDIRFMESEQGWSIPLERHRFGRNNHRMYFRYADPSFSINNQPLNESEAYQLKSALMVLSRFTGTPQFEWVNEIIPVIENKLGLVGSGEKVIAFDSNLDAAGLEYIKTLFDAITNKTVLDVIYKAFRYAEPIQFSFHPYYLKQYNNRWFVFGLNEQADKNDWNVALDRIQALTNADKPYIPNAIDWDEYFYDIVGVTKPEEGTVEQVELVFSSEQAPYVQTKPLHPSQRSKINEVGKLEVRIAVIINFELERLLLSFGDRVKVVAPLTLRDRIAALHQSAAKLYG